MPTTYAIPDGRTVMAATLWTGNGSARSIDNAVNGVSMQPDFVWVKSRTQAIAHRLVDSVRGAGNTLSSNLTNAEYSDPQGVTSFNSNGFGLGTDTSYNQSSDTYIGWQWKAGGTSSSNTNGSITSTVSAGATQGFSVVTYTGNGTNGATIGHGLGVAPNMIIVKGRSTTDGWPVYHASISNTQSLRLNTTAAVVTAGFWNNTTAGSSVFTVGGGTVSETNTTSATYVAYCFSAVAGYSAFGSYTGNGSADGPFVYLGFRPRFVMFKKTSATSNWSILDTSRDNFNVADNPLLPNTSGAESTSTSGSGAFADILSNGFKLRGNSGDINDSGATYIYACFAENPFKYANAR